MNRVIKFRVFEIIGKTMIYDGGVPFAGNRVAHELTKDKIMQFTGLKDWNKKEIYEGDIVRKGNFLYTIVESRGEWCLKRGNIILQSHITDLDFFGPRQLFSVEVVGNIYENPELLK